MKHIIGLISMLLFSFTQSLMACEVCKSNQPKGLENITHGPGPTGMIDYMIMGTAAILVIVTLCLSLKYLIHPKENNPDHIKNIVLNENF